MNVDLLIRFSSNDPLNHWLCFNCAVKAVNLGIRVETTIDDYDSEYYVGPTDCKHEINQVKREWK